MIMYHMDYEIIVNHLLLFSEELNVLEYTGLKKTKNDQSYFFYIHIKIIVGIDFPFSFKKKQMEKLDK